MMKLLEKYYNINYYCAYKLLFFLCWRLLNPLYWLSLLKWDNRYIKWCISIDKRHQWHHLHLGDPHPMHHQLLDALPCLPCLHQDFQGRIIEHLGYGFWKHLPLCLAFRSHRAVLVLCQSYIPVQARQVQEVFRRVR